MKLILFMELVKCLFLFGEILACQFLFMKVVACWFFLLVKLIFFKQLVWRVCWISSFVKCDDLNCLRHCGKLTLMMCYRTLTSVGIIFLRRLVVDPSAPDGVPFFSSCVIFIRSYGHTGENTVLSLTGRRKARKSVLLWLTLGDVILANYSPIRAKWVLRSSTVSYLLLTLVILSVNLISRGKVLCRIYQGVWLINDHVIVGDPSASEITFV